ncbi:MAG: hypothetical protein R2769_14880 [Saprospiraceae bacterium]
MKGAGLPTGVMVEMLYTHGSPDMIMVQVDGLPGPMYGFATGANYQPPTINRNYQYRRKARRSTCFPWVYSNTITIILGKSLR